MTPTTLRLAALAEDFEARLARAGYNVGLITYEGAQRSPLDISLDIHSELLGL